MSDQGNTPPPYPGQQPPPPPGQPPYGQQPPPPPPGYGGQPPFGMGGQPISDYLVWAILTTVLCCLPLGVVSIVFSTQVRSKQAMGDIAGAMEASRKAKLFAMLSAGTSLVLGVIWLLIVILGSLSSSSVVLPLR